MVPAPPLDLLGSEIRPSAWTGHRHLACHLADEPDEHHEICFGEQQFRAVLCLRMQRLLLHVPDFLWTLSCIAPFSQGFTLYTAVCGIAGPWCAGVARWSEVPSCRTLHRG